MTVSSRHVNTARLRLNVYESGPQDGIPVVLVHGNLSTGRFYEPTMLAAGEAFRMIAPDMRGFGRSDRAPLDATRGLRDWTDDLAALVDALGIDQPIHLLGWSTGAAAVAAYVLDRPGGVASLTLVDPVSPYGYGGTHGPDGTPNHDDFAGSGGGAVNPDFVAALVAGDRGTESPMSPLNVMRGFYWSPSHTVDPGWESVLLDELLMSDVGDDAYPGDSTPSDNWPGVAPGGRGILNALSGKYCRWDDLVTADPKPPVLWVHGSEDRIVADGALWDLGTLGQLGAVPGWPGADVFPPQPMVTQIRGVLDRYAAAGGHVVAETFEGSGHGPLIDAAERFQDVFFGFVARAAA